MTNQLNQNLYDFIVIGAGAAGYFAAINCAEQAGRPLNILILESGEQVLRKVKISGGGRCNVTNREEDPKELIKNYPRGQRNLLNAFFKFGTREMKNWLTKHNVEIKEEADGRVFPASDSSQSIIDIFYTLANRYDIKLQKKCSVVVIDKEEELFKVTTRNNINYMAKNVLLATGSNRAGHELAKYVGHSITETAPSLFTLKSKAPIVHDLAGISMQNVSVQLKVNKKKFKQTGPVLITHWGFSGPAIIKLSAFAAREFLETKYTGELTVNWLNDIKTEDLFLQFKKMQKENPKKKIENIRCFEIPKRLWLKFLLLSEIPEKPFSEIKDKQLRILSEAITNARYPFKGKGEFKEEFVTCGGIKLKEVDLKSFESKLVPGLHFAGEILDIDGITGGFNFQNAWTGGYLAAQNVLAKLDC